MENKDKIKSTYFVSFECSDIEIRDRIWRHLENSVKAVMLFEPKAEVEGSDIIYNCSYRNVIDKLGD